MFIEKVPVGFDLILLNHEDHEDMADEIGIPFLRQRDSQVGSMGKLTAPEMCPDRYSHPWRVSTNSILAGFDLDCCHNLSVLIKR